MSDPTQTTKKPFKMLISRERLIEKIMADPDNETITAGSNLMTQTTAASPTDDAVTVAYNVLRYAWDNNPRPDPPSRADVREALRQAFIQQAHESA